MSEKKNRSYLDSGRSPCGSLGSSADKIVTLRICVTKQLFHNIGRKGTQMYVNDKISKYVGSSHKGKPISRPEANVSIITTSGTREVEKEEMSSNLLWTLDRH